MWKGTQYMVTYAGGGLFGALKGDGVWLFSLDGTLNELPPDNGGSASQVAITVPDRQADLAAGESMYKAACVYCHGDSGAGGEGGGAQLTGQLAIADIMNVLGNGRNVMPNFSPVMSNEQMHDVASYLAEVLLPGR
jgi:mono/diheme cytochrome c family protein